MKTTKNILLFIVFVLFCQYVFLSWETLDDKNAEVPFEMLALISILIGIVGIMEAITEKKK